MESKAFAIVGQVITLFPSVIPLIQGLMSTIKEAGHDATPEQINAIVLKAVSQAAKIQSL